MTNENTTLNEGEIADVRAMAEKIASFALDAAAPNADGLTLSQAAGAALALHWAADSVEANILLLIEADNQNNA